MAAAPTQIQVQTQGPMAARQAAPSTRAFPTPTLGWARTAVCWGTNKRHWNAAGAALQYMEPFVSQLASRTPGDKDAECHFPSRLTQEQMQQLIKCGRTVVGSLVTPEPEDAWETAGYPKVLRDRLYGFMLTDRVSDIPGFAHTRFFTRWGQFLYDPSPEVRAASAAVLASMALDAEYHFTDAAYTQQFGELRVEAFKVLARTARTSAEARQALHWLGYSTVHLPSVLFEDSMPWPGVGVIIGTGAVGAAATRLALSQQHTDAPSESLAICGAFAATAAAAYTAYRGIRTVVRSRQWFRQIKAWTKTVMNDLDTLREKTLGTATGFDG